MTPVRIRVGPAFSPFNLSIVLSNSGGTVVFLYHAKIDSDFHRTTDENPNRFDSS